MLSDVTVIIPFRDGHSVLGRLLDSLPRAQPVIVVDDANDEIPDVDNWSNVRYIRLNERGYFTGAVNAGIAACDTDVLILNQDSYFENYIALDMIKKKRYDYPVIGERIEGRHPAFADGYIHGTFMFIRRDAWNAVGPMNEKLYPLWGSTAEWQIRAARRGYRINAIEVVDGFVHTREGGYGDSIRKLLRERPDERKRFLRTPPEISVIIPCYNQGRFLADAVASLIGGKTSLGDHPGQTMQSFEVIIVDDASTDDSLKYGLELDDSRKLVRYIRRERNGGTPAAHNTGIKLATGRYITCMSGDDMREPKGLESLYRACIENPHSFAYDDVQRFKQGTKTQLQPMPAYDFDTLIHKNLAHVGIMYPIEAWKEVGGYDERMRHGREDWQFNVALGLKGWCGVHVSEPNYLYRREGQNRTEINTTPRWRQFFSQQLREIHPEAYGENRPMACCGGRNSKATTARTTPSTTTAKTTTASGVRSRVTRPAPLRSAEMSASPGGMTQVTYTGRNVGVTTWGGAGRTPTGRRYRFGGNPRFKTKWVDNADLVYFDQQRENGEKLFTYTLAAEGEVPDTTYPVKDTGEGETVPAGDADAAAEQTPDRTTQPAEIDIEDTGEFTVVELGEKLKDKTLIAEEVRQMLEVEKSSKNRKGAISILEERLADFDA